jgi:hypothetical protein
MASTGRSIARWLTDAARWVVILYGSIGRALAHQRQVRTAEGVPDVVLGQRSAAKACPERPAAIAQGPVWGGESVNWST